MGWNSHKNIFYATSVLVGTIVGVGVFGLPYVMAQSGYSVGLLFLLVLGFVMIVIHLMMGEIILRTEGSHRIVGYAEMYLGKLAKEIVSLATIFGLYGALLAYIIVAGTFLDITFGDFFNIGTHWWGLVFYVVGIVLLWFGIRTIAEVELIMTLFLVGVVAVLFGRGLPSVEWQHLTGVSSDLKGLFLPYGVVLFSLGGISAIPELKELLKERFGRMKQVLVWGTVIPIIIYICFTFAVVGVTGPETHKQAIPGLIGHFGQWVIIVGALFGLAAVFTSFLVLGVNLSKIFSYDYHIPPKVSWILVVAVPLLFFLGGFKNFIDIIGVVGTVMGGISGIFIILIHRASSQKGTRKPEYTIRVPAFLRYGLIGVFVLGIVWQVFDIFFG